MVMILCAVYSILVLMISIGTGFVYMQILKDISPSRNVCFCTNNFILS